MNPLTRKFAKDSEEISELKKRFENLSRDFKTAMLATTLVAVLKQGGSLNSFAYSLINVFRRGEGLVEAKTPTVSWRTTRP